MFQQKDDLIGILGFFSEMLLIVKKEESILSTETSKILYQND